MDEHGVVDASKGSSSALEISSDTCCRTDEPRGHGARRTEPEGKDRRCGVPALEARTAIPSQTQKGGIWAPPPQQGECGLSL